MAIAVGDRFLYKGIKAFRGDSVSGTGAGAEDKEKPAAEKEEDKKDDKNKITTIAKIQVRQAGYRLRVTRVYYAINKEFLSWLGLELL
jgi:hypothetical protein